VWSCEAKEKLVIARETLTRFEEEHPKIIGKALKDTEGDSMECTNEIEKLRAQLCEAQKPSEELERLKRQLVEAQKPPKELEEMRLRLVKAKEIVAKLEGKLPCLEMKVSFATWKMLTCAERKDPKPCWVCEAKRWVEAA
jgi:hypothetical protein